jgi:hypothetical protein
MFDLLLVSPGGILVRGGSGLCQSLRARTPAYRNQTRGGTTLVGDSPFHGCHRSPDPAAGSLLSSRLWRPVCRRDNDEQLEPDGRHHGSFISLHRVRIAVAVTLIRGFARQRSPTIGNFWVDLTRGTLYVLIPICVLAALFLVSQGVPQTLAQPSRNLRLLPLRTF